MSRGNVYNLLHPRDQKDRIPFRKRILFGKMAAQGMNWLHQQTSLLHLDLKTANLLVKKHI